MTTSIATSPAASAATIGAEPLTQEHLDWLGSHPMAQAAPGTPIVVRRTGGRIDHIISASGSLFDANDLAARVAHTWDATHVPIPGPQLFDLGWRLDLRQPSPDPSAPAGGRLLAYAREDQCGFWAVSTGVTAQLSFASSKAAARQWLHAYGRAQWTAAQAAEVTR